ncbi:hypothetical protein IFM89_004321 [Coptis chinensis]|uniref:Uncharacterized protein n=1 Tax=Coptis chinensis TaxID=261450 RepID=A0A835I5F4_9MAGN|nr:hypothetical protein IFM89_004321 [Coptis chinensis]
MKQTHNLEENLMAQYADTMQIDEVHEERISAIEACLEKIISKGPTHAMVLEMPLVPFKWSAELGCGGHYASRKHWKAVEVQTPDADMLETMVKVIEVATKVLEAIDMVPWILPTVKRLHMVKVWLPFVRMMKPLVDSTTINDDDSPPFKMDGELWQSLESAFVSMPP